LLYFPDESLPVFNAGYYSDLHPFESTQISARNTAPFYCQNKLDAFNFWFNKLDLALQSFFHMPYEGDAIVFRVAAAAIFEPYLYLLIPIDLRCRRAFLPLSVSPACSPAW
jgi:hypothetical protein